MKQITRTKLFVGNHIYNSNVDVKINEFIDANPEIQIENISLAMNGLYVTALLTYKIVKE